MWHSRKPVPSVQARGHAMVRSLGAAAVITPSMRSPSRVRRARTQAHGMEALPADRAVFTLSTRSHSAARPERTPVLDTGRSLAERRVLRILSAGLPKREPTAPTQADATAHLLVEPKPPRHHLRRQRLSVAACACRLDWSMTFDCAASKKTTCCS